MPGKSFKLGLKFGNCSDLRLLDYIMNTDPGFDAVKLNLSLELLRFVVRTHIQDRYKVDGKRNEQTYRYRLLTERNQL